jgi:hypothetical protein
MSRVLCFNFLPNGAILNWQVVVLEKIVLAFYYYKKEKYTSKVKYNQYCL